MITMEEYVRQVNTNIELSQEIERLHSIIKEVREYIKDMTLYNEYDKCDTGMKNYQCTHLLEILDKVKEKENESNRHFK